MCQYGKALNFNPPWSFWPLKLTAQATTARRNGPPGAKRGSSLAALVKIDALKHGTIVSIVELGHQTTQNLCLPPCLRFWPICISAFLQSVFGPQWAARISRSLTDIAMRPTRSFLEAGKNGDGIRWFIDCNGQFPSNFNISMAKKQLIIVGCYGIQNSNGVCMGW